MEIIATILFFSLYAVIYYVFSRSIDKQLGSRSKMSSRRAPMD